MASIFKLRFHVQDFLKYSTDYKDDERVSLIDIGNTAREQGYLEKKHLMLICKWKTRNRSFRWVNINDESLVRETTSISLTARSEETRIGSLMILRGIKFPTASTILHFYHSDSYPIIDYRTLWTLGIERTPTYTYEFWYEYVKICRNLSQKSGCSMDIVDRALWQYSKLFSDIL